MQESSARLRLLLVSARIIELNTLDTITFLLTRKRKMQIEVS